MKKPPQIVFYEWGTYVAQRDDVTMFISFDDAVTHEAHPAALAFCARVWIPIQSPNAAGGPVSPESERLWEMEDELCSMLQEHRVHCRLVGRLTYGGLREIVFQLHDWESFRPPVGLWMMKHEDYKIDVSEHDGWQFFDDYIRPRIEDRLFMADRSVIDTLVQNGSNPREEHSLEYVFMGQPQGLERVARELLKRSYQPVGKLDYQSGTIELVRRLALDLPVIVQESISNHKVAEEAGVECNGWGAAVVT
jgi:hypothetical protein